MVQRLLLDCFDDSTPIQSPTDLAYQKGFENGHAAGLSAAKAAEAALSAELVQTIGDLQFKYSEARGEITQSLAPLLQTIASAVLPHIADISFAAQIATLLANAAQQDSDGKLTLVIHPSQTSAMVTTFAQCPHDLSIQEDATLGRHAALIQSNYGESLFDLDRLLGEIDEILNANSLPEPRIETHG